VVVVSFAPFAPHVGLRGVYDRTLGYQAGRGSPFSIWGQHAGLYDVWTACKVLAIALAVAVAFVPRLKTPVQVAALGAAVLLALEIVTAHWFYLYVVWFMPFVLVALFALHREPADAPQLAEEAPSMPAIAVA
jgi:hypothetical protein